MLDPKICLNVVMAEQQRRNAHVNLCIPKMELEILTLFFLDMYFLRASKATTIDIVVCCKESDLASDKSSMF